MSFFSVTRSSSIYASVFVYIFMVGFFTLFFFILLLFSSLEKYEIEKIIKFIITRVE
jgi:hypothetical protein